MCKFLNMTLASRVFHKHSCVYEVQADGRSSDSPPILVINLPGTHQSSGKKMTRTHIYGGTYRSGTVTDSHRFPFFIALRRTIAIAKLRLILELTKISRNNFIIEYIVNSILPCHTSLKLYLLVLYNRFIVSQIVILLVACHPSHRRTWVIIL